METFIPKAVEAGKEMITKISDSKAAGALKELSDKAKDALGGTLQGIDELDYDGVTKIIVPMLDAIKGCTDPETLKHAITACENISLKAIENHKVAGLVHTGGAIGSNVAGKIIYAVLMANIAAMILIVVRTFV